MSDKQLSKIQANKAVTICQDIDMEPATQALLTPDMLPHDFLQILISEQRWPDAVKFLARALPKRESTWWACVAARSMLIEPAQSEVMAALEAAEAWVYRPSEDNRRLSYSRAQAAGFDHPASWAAMAAFWSGGSMTPPDVPVVPPADNLTGKAAAGAVMLAAVQSDAAMGETNYRRFMQQGIDIAAGGNGRMQEEQRNNG